MKWEKYQDLNYISQVQAGSNTCLVLFHGYGADANDLASLGQVFQLNQNTDYFFPQGPIQVPISPMMMGRAWFSLRVSDLEPFSGGAIPDVGFDQEILQVLDKVTEWLNHLGTLYENVLFGGFSQGAILSSHSFYRLNFSPKALLLLSGYLVAPSEFPTLPDALKVPFFQSHGLRDEVLSVKGGQKLYQKLSNLGLKGQWVEFHGGHEIPMNVIADVQNFINKNI